MRLRAQAMIWGLVWMCMIQCPSGLSQHCDNGKAKLETDLPPPDELQCPKSTAGTSALISSSAAASQLLYISTRYPLQPAQHVCMDLPIIYNQTIPSSGAHRPVGAQSGEYLYCPPQRWINNLKDGATVLLFHPCTSMDARRSLAVLAHSCLPHFILTSHPQLSQHRPFAFVSWGHTLEISHITTAGVCDWILTFPSNFNRTTRRSPSPNYNLYLIKPAPVDRVRENSVRSLEACCVEALSAFKATARDRKIRSVLQPATREIEKEEVKRTENASLISFDTLNLTHTEPLNRNEGKDSLSLSPRGHVTPPLNTTVQSEKHDDGNVETDAKTTSMRMKKLKEPHVSTRGEETIIKVPDSQTNVKSHKASSTVSSARQRVKTDVDEPSAGEDCAVPGYCGPPDVATAVMGGPLRGNRVTFQRSDEAVWAAAALGFLLVLLTLSVLHTRLYRNCRAPSSLYWPERQQDYECVADIIRRRLRMVGRRKRRASQARRQECPLLSDSSTDND